ncbi:aminoglycoside phosphotransferase family protein [Chryseobacterium fluminis]|uniref:phosphotransferase enzyme family protein n=1 Tax=Chryseobacterium fluminis TaxID=2983606 RepID=UPI00224E38F1|nr:aminoglycoside phosphotransferase family protein [Chryseobacterium sp. MMS21-Ot14]UZT99303.1 aminoglycoside phosphotransferase family protein [Chryseobacterium sp. MMS21-Ot14]
MELDLIVRKFIGIDCYDIQPITNGLVNSTYLLENYDQDKKYILQKINNQVFKNPDSLITNHLLINAQLQSHHYELIIIDPVPAYNQQLLVYDKSGQPWRMQHYIESSTTFLKVPSKETAYEAAKAFGHFLDIVNTGDGPEIADPLPDFTNFEKRISDYKRALRDADPDLIEKAKAEIELTNHLLLLPNRWIELIKNKWLPERIIHADAKISNILFDENAEALAVIDMDTVMVSTILYDFGTMIQSYTNSTHEDDGNATDNFNAEMYAVKEGFLFHLKERLTPEESENLDYAAQVVIYIQEVRFLTDHLNGNKYYAVKYDDHNLDRTKNQLRLLEGLRKYLKV